MTGFVDRVVVQLLWYLGEWSLRWGIILAMLAAWLAVRPPRKVATRYLLGMVALLAGMVLPLAPRWSPGFVPWPLSWPRPVGAPVATVPPVPGPEWTTPRFEEPPLRVFTSDRPRPPAAVVAAAHPPRASFGLGRAVALATAGVWCLMTLTLLVRLLAGHALLQRLRRSATALGGDSPALLETGRAALGLGRKVGLAAHPAVASPVALGGVCPVLLVPPGWESWPEADRRACLLHELAHLAYRDDWAKFVQELVRAPFFFHPLVHWLLGRLDHDRELLCDEAVVALGAEPVAYARLLLDLARRPGRLLPGAAVFRPGWLPFLDRRTIAARIERLLEDDMAHAIKPVAIRRLLALGILSFAASLGIGGLTVRALEPEPPRQLQPVPAARGDESQPRKKMVSGIVHDAEGNPLSGVQVVGCVEWSDLCPEILTTGADGRFAFAIPAGEGVFSVAAHKEGMTLRAVEFSFQDGKDPRDLDFLLRKPGHFEAKLVDRAGEDLVGATIRIERSAVQGPLKITRDGGTTRQAGGTWYMSVPWVILTGTRLERVLTTTTDARGRFAFDVVSPGALLKLTASVPGRDRMLVANQSPVPAAPPLLVNEGFVISAPEAPATLVAKPAAKVRGRVVTRLPGVLVAGHAIGLQGARDLDQPSRDLAWSLLWAEARTDREGRFEIDGLVAGQANLFLKDAPPDGPWAYRAVKNAPLRLGETSNVEIELIAGVKVEGRVLATGTRTPVAGAPVGLYGPIRPRSGAAIIATKTGGDGTYHFRLPPGETYFYICGQLSGYTTLPGDGSSRTVVIPEGTTDFTVPPIEVQPAVRVRGRIVDAQGVPVLGARVVGVCDQNRCMPLDQPSAMTDAQGRFQLSDQPGGEFPVAQASTFQVELRDARKFEVAAVPGHSGEVVLKLAAFSAPELKGPAAVAPDELAGLVVDAGGNPLAGVQVAAFYWIPKPPATRTDDHGLFRLAKLPARSEVSLRLRKEGYETQYHVRPTGAAGWVAVLGNTTYFEGCVLGADGAPVAGALIRGDVGPKRGNGSIRSGLLSETTSGTDGRYRLYVVPDQYDIAVRVPGAGVARLPKQSIAADQHRMLDIRLAPGVEFVAKCVDSVSGEPVAGVRLEHWQRPGIEGTSDATGAIVIRDVPPGNYPRFEVEAEGYTRWWSGVCLSEWARYQKSARHGFQRNFDGLDFDIQPGIGPVTIQLERGATVRGQVLDPEGRPVAKATVAPALTGSGNSLTGDTRFSVETGDDGRFEVLLPASGDIAYNLVAHDGQRRVNWRLQWRNWANGVTAPFKTTPGSVTEGVEIRLTRPGTVTGRVLDAEGQPVAGREVRAQPAARDENRYYDPTTETDADGRFVLKFVRPGEQFVQAAPFWLDAAGAPAGTSRTVTVVGGQTVAGVELRAGPR